MCIHLKKKKFELLPVTTLLGGSCSNIKAIAKQRTIDDAFRQKYFFTRSAARILGMFSSLEERAYRQKMKGLNFVKPPVFIIGFWRSGTTLMHQLMTLNKEFGFLNTYHSVFPNHILANQWWLKNIAKLLLPDTRPGDNMKLDFSYPQEEEIALGNLQPISFYNFFYFPRDIQEFISESLFFENISEEQFHRWKEAYTYLMNTALINTNGNQFVSKNPPNTFRIKILLDMFPEAKFIYMHRNTYETIYSFIRFVQGVLKGVKLQEYDETENKLQLIRLYKLMQEAYAKDKVYIPEGQLVEVEYEYFKDHKKEELSRIYNQLGLDGFEETVPRIDFLLHEINDFKRSNHQIDESFKSLINSELGDLVDLNTK
ncbi:MAG: sulfotransferase [Bacteroidales bacterium]|nr:sulfotransferase [Bacteroidales bacterium]